ncbi:MAG: UMP kinase [Candidatus Paceibacterota bacterium]|jgi:uridylate kinase
MKYKRVLLKLSGEMFGKEGEKGVSLIKYAEVAKEIAKIKKDNDIDLAVVIGGGNIFRGREVGEENFDRVTADYMGMLGTVINSLGLQESLEVLDVPTRTMSAIRMDTVTEPFLKRKALHHLAKGRIVIFAGGTGNSFFTTDTTAALRACEVDCDLILKATNVDGVYSEDPKKNPDARLYKKISYGEAIEKNLNIMDSTAFTICQENKKPIIVFNINDLKNVSKALNGEEFGTLVS